jgi:methionyl-tRNA formyltransferase
VLTPSPVKQRALQLALPVSQPERLASPEQRASLTAWHADLLVVVAYGLILPDAVLRLPRLGCLNIHASLLPRWRGAAPIARAILAGDADTGVAIMGLEATLDTGPVYAERRLPITARSTAAELLPQLAVLGATALLEVTEALAAGTAVSVPQRADGVSYAHKLSKAEALIDWNASAALISRQVRAFNPWPVAETLLDGERVRLWRAWEDEAGSVCAVGAVPGAVLELRDGALRVACGSGVLAIDTLQLPGKRVIHAADFSNTRVLQGLRFGADP